MSYTVLRVTAEGVVHFEGHANRLAAAGDDALRAFHLFARKATAGIYVLKWSSEGLLVERRESSRYFDGMPVRFHASPLCGQLGPVPKPAPPSIYAHVRLLGVATLLTSADGEEIYEACSAGIVAWDGANLVVPPEDRPRVISTTESTLRESLPLREAPIQRHSDWPLGAINAVAGVTRLNVPGRSPFPQSMVNAIEAVCRHSTRRR